MNNSTLKVTVTYEVALSTDSFSMGTIAIYPNPAKDVITVKAGEFISEIRLYNLLGQRVLTQKGNGLSTEVNIVELSAGNYILKALTKNGKATTSKVIKH